MRRFDHEDPKTWDRMIANYEEEAHPFTAWFAQNALDGMAFGSGTHVLDIATGIGAAALAAAARGAHVLAVDFSPGMIGRVAAMNIPNVEARVMDGQALDLPDGHFDLSISMFGIMLFPDWRRGLREMARVTRAGGTAVLGTWKHPRGAATHLLVSGIIGQLFPDLEQPAPPAGMAALRDPATLAEEMVAAGFARPAIREATHDFLLRLDVLDDPDRLLALIPHWAMLDDGGKAAVLREIRRRGEEAGRDGVLPIPSTALIATARRNGDKD